MKSRCRVVGGLEAGRIAGIPALPPDGTPWNRKDRCNPYGNPVRESWCCLIRFPGNLDRVPAARLLAFVASEPGFNGGNEQRRHLGAPLRRGAYGCTAPCAASPPTAAPGETAGCAAATDFALTNRIVAAPPPPRSPPRR